jgi:hypothetical protein
MASAKKQLPEFRSEDDERKFWVEHDSTEFIEWKSAHSRQFRNLKRAKVRSATKARPKPRTEG